MPDPSNQLSGNPGTLPPLLPCPMCGSDKGYTLGTGPTYRWWNMNCNGCGRIVDECASDRRHHFDSKLPDRWPAADEAWNEAGAYAAAAVAMEREKWESLCRAQGFLYMIEKRAKMK